VVEDVDQAVVSAVNLAEVAGKLIDAGLSELEVSGAIARLQLHQVEPFDEPMAYDVGALRATTRAAGLSLGDRACLALGRRLSLPVLTADREWAKVKAGVKVKVIR
jgi:ribonuclease VapC